MASRERRSRRSSSPSLRKGYERDAAVRRSDDHDDGRRHRDERRRSRSRSPTRRRRSRSRERDRNERRRRRDRDGLERSENERFGKDVEEEKVDDAEENKDKPDFGLSGKLAQDTNTYRGVVIKYSEPPEAKVPKKRWRFYPFKGDESLSTLYIHRQSAYLIGRDKDICDIPMHHPSISKQHAVLQYRLVDHEKPDGSMVKKVKPYVIDLESTNGTYVNNNRIDPSRFVELFEKDMLKFGFSSREYVLLHEHSADNE
ncbi:smad nuclear interacting protein 1-like [Oscarella lobularis]|uniref:smad nuclear interacting protein 1-like n=1 Tax=Oscarella lobularis TaxID=121494 RepID=UPI00331344BE